MNNNRIRMFRHPKVGHARYLSYPDMWQTFVCPYTGYVFNKNYNNIHEVVSHVINYRLQNPKQFDNKITVEPFIDTADEVIDHFCNTEPFKTDWVENPRYKDKKITYKITHKHIWSGFKAFFKKKYTEIKYKNKEGKIKSLMIVDQATAESRGLCCKTCPFNDKFANYTLLDKAMLYISKNFGTKYDKFAKMCKLCRCPLPPKWWYNIITVRELLSKDEEAVINKRFADTETGKLRYCWMKTDWDDYLKKVKAVKND